MAVSSQLTTAELAAGGEDVDEVLSRIDEVASLVEGLAKGTISPEARFVLTSTANVARIYSLPVYSWLGIYSLFV